MAAVRVRAIHEILDEADKQPDVQARAEVLKKNSSKQLKLILDYTFNKNLHFDLPHGDPPPYTPSGGMDLEHAMYQEADRFYVLLKGGQSRLTRARKEEMFMRMLETVHPKDVPVLVGIKDKKLPQANVTREVVQAAFPTLIKE